MSSKSWCARKEECAFTLCIPCAYLANRRLNAAPGALARPFRRQCVMKTNRNRKIEFVVAMSTIVIVSSMPDLYPSADKAWDEAISMAGDTVDPNCLVEFLVVEPA